MKPYGLWYNIHAKRKRIKNGSNERMRKPGSKGAPTDSDFKNASEEFENIMERGKDSKGHYRSTEDGAGLTQKGAKAMGVKTAVTTPPSKLDPDGKAAKRRKSFCARMSGMEGPMKDEKGRPTRKAMSLKRWNCNEELEEGMLDGIKKSKVFHKKEYSQALNILKDVLNRKGKTKPLYYAAQVSRSFPHVDPKELIKMIQEGKVTVHFKKDGFGDKETYRSEDEARKSIKILKDEGFKITKVIGSKKLEEEDMTQQNPLQGKIDTLLRSGFVDKTEVAVARRAIQKLNSDETLTPDERSLIQRVFKKLLDIVTKKESIFGSVRKSLSVQEEETEVQEEFKAGDKVHLGMKTKGGAGYRGVVDKVKMGWIYITIPSDSKWGPRTIKGQLRNASIDESYIDEMDNGVPDSREKRERSPEGIARRKKEQKDLLKKVSPEMKKKLRLGKFTSGMFYYEDVAEEDLTEGQYEMMMRNGQVKKFNAKDDADAKRIANGNNAKSVIKLRNGVPAGKLSEEDLAEGRPSQRHALDGHDYHKKPDHHLRHIMKDAGEAAKNAQGMGDSKGEGKYRDQVNDAATVLHFRKQNGMPAWYRKKYGHDGVKEELDLSDATPDELIEGLLDIAKGNDNDSK